MGIKGGSLEEEGVLAVDAGGREGAGPKDRGEGAGRDVPGGGDRMCIDSEVLKGWRCGDAERNPV